MEIDIINMENNIEIWKDIPGYEGSYQVSNLGRVKSLDRQVIQSNGRSRFFKGKYMKLSLDTNGYYKICLRKGNNNKITKQIHQLVAISFLGHIPDGHNLVVDHINNDKLDNRVDNLQLISSRINDTKDKKVLGAYFRKDRGTWFSRIIKNNKSVYLGSFNNEQEARTAYLNELKNIIK